MVRGFMDPVNTVSTRHSIVSPAWREGEGKYMNTRSIILTVSLLLTLSTSISAAPGDLDPTFGNGGIVITNIPNVNNGNGPTLYAAYAMAIQPDGKIVVVGEGFTN